MAQNWLCKVGFEYKYICKNVFINRHECLNVVEDWNNFLIEMKNLKLYIVEFEEDSKIKPKVYLSDYAIKGNNWQLIIVIAYNKYTFSSNNSIWRV